MTTNYLLLFHLQLSSNNNLIPGRLLLINKDRDSLENIYSATSGLPQYQTRVNLSTVGRGAIPPHDEVGIAHYTVDTSPIYMPNVKGVEGNFYKIDPHSVTIKAMSRGDFGCHFDANVPGSSGCIVLRTKVGWDGFESDMKRFKDQNMTTLPLLVSYTTL